MKNDSEMTIKEWVTRDVDRAAFEVLASAVYEIYAGTFKINGCPRISQASFEFAGKVVDGQIAADINPEFRPKWIDDVLAIIEKHGDQESFLLKEIKEIKSKEE